MQCSKYSKRESNSSVGCLQRQFGCHLPSLQQVNVHHILCNYMPLSWFSPIFTLHSVDEIEAANSLCISPDGEKLYCGFDKCIRMFDVQIPGRNCQTRPTKCEKYSVHNYRRDLDVYLWFPKRLMAFLPVNQASYRAWQSIQLYLLSTLQPAIWKPSVIFQRKTNLVDINR